MYYMCARRAPETPKLNRYREVRAGGWLARGGCFLVALGTHVRGLNERVCVMSIRVREKRIIGLRKYTRARGSRLVEAIRSFELRGRDEERFEVINTIVLEAAALVVGPSFILRAKGIQRESWISAASERSHFINSFCVYQCLGRSLCSV